MSKATDIFTEPLDWLFWPPLRPRPDSAWLGHIPFAHWLVGRMRPRIIVELGTFSGASYAAFCDAVVRNGLETKLFAVDTWAGDAHTGTYGERIYADLKGFNETRFAGLSSLMRMTFDEACGQFADGSIDLLHIDGLHTYEAVKHDFETWLPRLSERAIVLFHDTAQKRDDFGVWQLWAELRERYAGIEFLHSHGLGVLQVGPETVPEVVPLFALEGDEVTVLQQRFEALGNGTRMFAHAAAKHVEVEQLKQMLRQAKGG